MPPTVILRQHITFSHIFLLILLTGTINFSRLYLSIFFTTLNLAFMFVICLKFFTEWKWFSRAIFWSFLGFYACFFFSKSQIIKNQGFFTEKFLRFTHTNKNNGFLIEELDFFLSKSARIFFILWDKKSQKTGFFKISAYPPPPCLNETKNEPIAFMQRTLRWFQFFGWTLS